jgi:pyridinium-3,5-bisthiocarboxylic acid mononucleotide nickel chelatase
MRIAYFDCFSGISGDMTLGALLDCGAERAELDGVVEALRLGDEVSIEVRREPRGHVTGTRVEVRVTRERERTVPALRAAVEQADAPAAVVRGSLDAIDRIASAESRLHGVPLEELHLHELGGADTLVDVVGAFWLLHALGVDAVHASPLPAPRGIMGGMPLPAPASLGILAGSGATLEPVDASRELVTPTGAAILAAAATFTRPAISLDRIGYGAGAHDSPGNVLAVWLGTAVASDAAVTLVETNLDDMAPNLVAALVEDVMAAGALDVTVVPALMKKGRPGHVLTAMVAPELAGAMSELLLGRSTTLGVRVRPAGRVVAGRRTMEVETPLGRASVKVKELGGRAVDVAPEFEDCRRISRATGTDLREVFRVVDAAARRELGLR